MLDQTISKFSELSPFRWDGDAVRELVSDVYQSFDNANRYHNYKHVVDVMQSTWYFLRAIGVSKTVHSVNDSAQLLKSLLQPIDILALLLASLGHDVGHPGINNNFMVAIASPLALLYDDKSVLESYHSIAFFSLLERFYSRRGVELRAYSSYKRFYETIIQSILCTDMSQHNEYIKSCREQTIRARTNSIGLSVELEVQKERLAVCSAILKCVDISNCARPFKEARNWAKVLLEELFLQGDFEKELDLPSIPTHQRGHVRLADFQLIFMINVASDLYRVVSELFPELGFCRDILNEIIKKWMAFHEEEEEKKEKHRSGEHDCMHSPFIATFNVFIRVVSLVNHIPKLLYRLHMRSSIFNSELPNFHIRPFGNIVWQSLMTDSLLNILSYTREIVITCTFLTIVFTRSVHVTYFTVCAVFATIVAKVLKSIIKQPRPVPKLVKENDKLKVKVKKSYGMPSSHSTAISFFAAYIQCVMMYDFASNSSSSSSFTIVLKYVALTLFHCFAFGVIWSRVRLEHHTKAQVIAGTLLGMSLAIISYVLWKECFCIEASKYSFFDKLK